MELSIEFDSNNTVLLPIEYPIKSPIKLILHSIKTNDDNVKIKTVDTDGIKFIIHGHDWSNSGSFIFSRFSDIMEMDEVVNLNLKLSEIEIQEGATRVELNIYGYEFRNNILTLTASV